MAVDPAAVAAVAARLSQAGVRSTDRIIVVHVSAGNPFRRWPLPSFVAVAAQLAAADTRHRVVITSGPSDRVAAEQVIADARARLPDDQRAHVVSCGEFSLAELRA